MAADRTAATVSGATLAARFAPAVALALIVALVLFEPLFLGFHATAIDPRCVPPFVALTDATDTPRAMNVVAGDATVWLLPDRERQRSRVLAGELPLWSPHQGAGQPLQQSLGCAPFHPALLLDLALGVERGFVWNIALHLLLAGWGTWAWLRHAGRGRLAALLGAAVFTLSGWMSAHLQLPNAFMSLAWFPWLLLLAERLAERPSARRVGALALALGCCLLGGFPQVALTCLWVALAWGLARALRPPRRAGTAAGGFARPALPRDPPGSEASGPDRPRARACLALLVAVGLGATLAGSALVPAQHYLAESTRARGFDRATLRSKSLTPPWLLTLLLPHAFGPAAQTIDPRAAAIRRVDEFPTARAWQPPEIHNTFEDSSLGVGVVALALAWLAAVRREGRGAALAWLLALAVALGVPLLADIAWSLPGVAAGSPKRVLALAPLALAALAAATLDRLVRGERPRLMGAGLALCLLAASLAALDPAVLLPGIDDADRAWLRDVVGPDLAVLAVAGAVLVGAGLLARRGRGRTAACLLLAAVAAEGVRFARITNPAQPPRARLSASAGVRWLQSQGATDRWRLLSFDAPEVLPASQAQGFGLRSLNAVSSMLPERLEELLHHAGAGLVEGTHPWTVRALQDPDALRSPLLDLLGVRFVVTGVAGHQRLLDAGVGPPAYAGAAEGLAVFERPAALPPVFAVAQVQREPDDARRLARLSAPGFDPATLALLEADAPGTLPDDLPPHTELSWQRPSPEQLLVDVPGPGPTCVVVSEAYVQGWSAELDGRPWPLLHADHAFMAVLVPAGDRQRISLRYRPASLTPALIAAALALTACLTLLAGPRRPGRVRMLPG